MGQIFPAGEEPQQRPALLGNVITHRSPQHWIAGFNRVKDGTQSNRAFHVKHYLAADVRQDLQMCREVNSDHGSVWTSTESTAGRSRTMGSQLSPALADAYTCPPVVPKYTPHESRESTAIASRSTLT